MVLNELGHLHLESELGSRPDGGGSLLPRGPLISPRQHPKPGSPACVNVRALKFVWRGGRRAMLCLTNQRACRAAHLFVADCVFSGVSASWLNATGSGVLISPSVRPPVTPELQRQRKGPQSRLYGLLRIAVAFVRPVGRIPSGRLTSSPASNLVPGMRSCVFIRQPVDRLIPSRSLPVYLQ